MSRPHFRASVRARTPEEGGRSVPIFIVGYKPDLAFENEEYWWGARLSADADEQEDRPRIELGQSREVDFVLRFPSEIAPRLDVIAVIVPGREVQPLIAMRRGSGARSRRSSIPIP